MNLQNYSRIEWLVYTYQTLLILTLIATVDIFTSQLFPTTTLPLLAGLSAISLTYYVSVITEYDSDYKQYRAALAYPLLMTLIGSSVLSFIYATTLTAFTVSESISVTSGALTIGLLTVGLVTLDKRIQPEESPYYQILRSYIRGGSTPPTLATETSTIEVELTIGRERVFTVGLRDTLSEATLYKIGRHLTNIAKAFFGFTVLVSGLILFGFPLLTVSEFGIVLGATVLFYITGILSTIGSVIMAVRNGANDSDLLYRWMLKFTEVNCWKWIGSLILIGFSIATGFHPGSDIIGAFFIISIVLIISIFTESYYNEEMY